MKSETAIGQLMYWYYMKRLQFEEQFLSDIQIFADDLEYSDEERKELIHIVENARDGCGVKDGFRFFCALKEA